MKEDEANRTVLIVDHGRVIRAVQVSGDVVVKDHGSMNIALTIDHTSPGYRFPEYKDEISPYLPPESTLTGLDGKTGAHGHLKTKEKARRRRQDQKAEAKRGRREAIHRKNLETVGFLERMIEIGKHSHSSIRVQVARNVLERFKREKGL